MKMRVFKFALLAAALAFAPMLQAQAPKPVRTLSGPVQGTTDDGIAAYLGIPFAAPPVGDLRWRAPQPVAPWKDVLPADKFAPGCMQTPLVSPAIGFEPIPISEDCLYLNVWTPAKTPRDRLAVMVWIYGGGFTTGATSIPIYNGANLAKKGVIVVSVSYRVGALGFLAHSELSAESNGHSGNYGLLDQIAGLQWVMDNIAAFGGDPKRVTIFGESAGGISVSMLTASPLAKGLFQGAISESGGSFGPANGEAKGPGENMAPLADAERAGDAWASAAGASTV